MRYVVFGLCVLGVFGCAPVSTYYDEGVSVAKFQRDTTGCDVLALRDAPIAHVIRQSPHQFVTRRYCHRTHGCHDRGYWVPGETYKVDVNAPLRARVKGQCMADRGYRPVELPACPPAVAKAAPAGPSPVLPDLNANSCAIRTDGGLRVVTQG